MSEIGGYYNILPLNGYDLILGIQWLGTQFVSEPNGTLEVVAHGVVAHKMVA